MDENPESPRERLLAAVTTLLARDADPLTAARICETAGVSAEELTEAFGTPSRLIDAWFSQRVSDAARLAGDVPGADTAGFAERLGTICFVFLDVLEPYRGITPSLFRYNPAGLTADTRGQLRKAMVRITDAPDVPGVNRLVVDTSVMRYVLADAVLRLVVAALEDTSEGRTRSAALIDRTVDFLAELATDGVPQRLIDLLKYTWESGYFSIGRFERWFGGESRDDNPVAP